MLNWISPEELNRLHQLARKVAFSAAVGRIAIQFLDRAGDVHPGIDDAHTISGEFLAKVKPLLALENGETTVLDLHVMQMARGMEGYFQAIAYAFEYSKGPSEQTKRQPLVLLCSLLDALNSAYVPGHPEFTKPGALDLSTRSAQLLYQLHVDSAVGHAVRAFVEPSHQLAFSGAAPEEARLWCDRLHQAGMTAMTRELENSAGRSVLLINIGKLMRGYPLAVNLLADLVGDSIAEDFRTALLVQLRMMLREYQV